MSETLDEDAPSPTAEAYEGQDQLWAAINRYAIACGGNPSSGVYGNKERMRAVVAVEIATRLIRAVAGRGRGIR